MKPTKNLIGLMMLTTILLSAGAILVFSQGDEVRANVAWDPSSYSTDQPLPDPWNAEIWLTGGHTRDEIDTTTILLEGMYTPSADPYPAVHGPRLIVPFAGSDVYEALLSKLPHTEPGRYRIALEITGNLYDGTPFRGSGTIRLEITNSTNPP